MLVRSLKFDIAAFEDLAWWIEKDRSEALRIVSLIKDIGRESFSDIGKPEPLKHDFRVAGRDASTKNIGSFIRFYRTR